MNSHQVGCDQVIVVWVAAATEKVTTARTTAPAANETKAAANGSPRSRPSWALIGACTAMQAPEMTPRRTQSIAIGFTVRLLYVGCNLLRVHLVGIAHRLAALDLVDILHAGDDLAPDGVLLVEEAGIVEHDEELRIGAVRVLRTGHRDHAANMRLAAELLLEVRIVRATGAGARHVALVGIAVLDVAGLRHEAIDHAMEHHAVVQPLTRQLLDVRDVVGRQVGAHLDDHRTLGGIDDERVLGIFVISQFSYPYLSTILAAMILSGSWTSPDCGSPFLILLTTSMPATTLPNTVYWPWWKQASAVVREGGEWS